MEPEVSILMCVYNGEKYLSEAINSILNQTFEDFEFIIINDASVDKSSKIISEFYDKRIKYYKNDKNIGLTASLNKGILLSKGKYIARMDCDDISLPSRLEKQVKFMNENASISVLGTWFECYPSGKVVKRPCKHEEIYAQLFISNAIAHPSVTIRKDILINNNIFYNQVFKMTQDYELWSRLIEITRFANIPEVLLRYREHDNQVSTKSSIEQQLYNTEVKINLYSKLLNLEYKEALRSSLKKLYNTDLKISKKDFLLLKEVFEKGITSARQKKDIKSELFISLHVNLLKRVFDRTGNKSLFMLPGIIVSPLFWKAGNRVKASYIINSLKETFIKQ